ncbi:MAG: response regulator [Rhodocyclaceae bacterium]
MKLHVLLAEHRLSFGVSLRAMLLGDPQIEAVTVHSEAAGLLDHVLQIAPDILCFDTDMPGLDAIEVIRQLSAARPQVKTIALSASASWRLALAMLDAGAAGFVAKSGGKSALLRAVLGIGRYERTYLCPDVAAGVLSLLRARQAPALPIPAAHS